MNILGTIFAPFVAIGVALGSLFAPAPEPQLGASEAIPVVVAFFETTLQSPITNSATSFTLTSATDKDGNTLASSTYAFVIDEGSANEEIVIADCTGTTCTNALRGISVLTGNTEVAALKKSHRRGSSVKITDAPILMLVSRLLRGEDILDMTPQGNGSLVTKEYVDSIALGSTTVAATYTDDGKVELATGTEAASSTPTGQSGSPLTLHTGISTSTAPSSGAYVVVTEQDGNIDPGFIDELTTVTLSGPTYGGFYATATASSTFTGATYPQAAFITASGTASTTSASATSTFGFSGFAVTDTASGSVVTIQTSGIVTGFTGLTKGQRYFTAETAGTIKSTSSALSVPVGTAINSNELLIENGKRTYVHQQGGLVDSGNIGATVWSGTINPGFIPTKITVWCGNDIASTAAGNYITYIQRINGTSYGQNGMYYVSSWGTPTADGFSVVITQQSTSPIGATMTFIIEE